MSERIQTYGAFFPYYLREHSQPFCRALHYIGTTIALVMLIAGLIERSGWLILAAFASGYLFAWIGHFFIEKNKPATFQYPLWSLISDFRMYSLFLTGRIGAALKEAGVGEE